MKNLYLTSYLFEMKKKVVLGKNFSGTVHGPKMRLITRNLEETGNTMTRNIPMTATLLTYIHLQLAALSSIGIPGLSPLCYASV